MADDLKAILFGFLQASFFGEMPKGVTPDFSDAVARLREHQTLQARTVTTWPAASRLALKELLTNWIIVLHLAEDSDDGYPIPTSWLSGASSTRLSAPIVTEILAWSDDLQLLYQRRSQG
jgi:hypothetical protein